MKHFLPLLLTSVWAFAAARLGDEENRELQGFERLKIVVFEAEITREEFDGGRTAYAPFYLKDNLSRKAGTWSDSQFFGPDIGADSTCTGVTMVVFKNELDSISLEYACEGSPDIITGGTGKYLGANGEAIFNQQPTQRTTLLKIVV